MKPRNSSRDFHVLDFHAVLCTCRLVHQGADSASFHQLLPFSNGLLAGDH